MTVTYADDAIGEYTLHRRPVRKRGVLQLAPGQGIDGYGRKITTDICLRFAGEKQERRVYCSCFSNNAPHYILIKDQPIYLRTHYQDEILS